MQVSLLQRMRAGKRAAAGVAEPEKTFSQGSIQVTSAFYRRLRHNRLGNAALLQGALQPASREQCSRLSLQLRLSSERGANPDTTVDGITVSNRSSVRLFQEAALSDAQDAASKLIT